MATTTDPIKELLDKNDIANLVADIGRFIDSKQFDDLSHVYSVDARLKTPDGVTTGVDAIIQTAQRNHEMFERTQHLVAGVSIDLQVDEAVVDANIVAIFVPAAAVPQDNRIIGIHYAFDALRTADGWRFTRMSITPVWTR
ncbi:nuclear transport factor 2 family protein [Antrihabitans stalactiti]|uniref:nuclear transport factor 2 family protein n=1 Tax=Antrihabitans stalactiti TaxID=2584121 RepID=UPI00146AFF05